MSSDLSESGIQRIVNSRSFPVAIFWGGIDALCTGVNQRWIEISGLSEEESLGAGWLRAIHPDDFDRVVTEQSENLRTRGRHRMEWRLVQPDGGVRWVLSEAVSWRDADDRVGGYAGALTDITDRVAAEAALRESEERFRNLVELSPDFICIHRGGVMTYVNAAGQAMMAATSIDQLVGHHILEFVLPRHQAIASARMAALQAGSALPLAEMEVRRCDGRVIWIETIASATVWEGAPAVQLVARDVTERRRIAETYRTVVESVSEAMWVTDRAPGDEWRFSFVNSAYLRQSKLESAAPLLGKSLPELVKDGIIPAADATEVLRQCGLACEADGPRQFQNELTWNGLTLQFETTITPVRNAAGECDRLIGWSRDLGRRREHERALAESEANYRAVVEGTSDALWVMDRGDDGQYRVRIANARTAQILGVDIGDMVGRTLGEFRAREEALAAEERYAQAEANGGPIEYENVIERDGQRVETVVHLTPHFDEEGRCYRIIASARDVTDRRRTEAALAQVQKLDSLGVLAGGIAHDFNNLLTTILGNLYLLDSELPADSPLRDYIADSRTAGERGADLVKRLLGYSRPGVHVRLPVPLDQLVSETVTLVQRTLGPSVILDIGPAQPGAEVIGEFAALQQVLVNLLLNARDAMPGGGTITIRHSRRELRAEALWAQRGVIAGSYHELVVSDTGAGMPREVIERIVDPFFTTKGIGKGTGLGLSTAFGIAIAHGGWLSAESVVGKGSVFRLLLPMA